MSVLYRITIEKILIITSAAKLSNHKPAIISLIVFGECKNASKIAPEATVLTTSLTIIHIEDPTK